MKLAKTVKSIGNIKRIIRTSLDILLVSICAVEALSCAQTPPKPKPAPPINEAPDTQGTKEFIGNGKVEYCFSGKDPDGSVSHISVKVNDGNYYDFENNTCISVSINKGPNKIEAIAYDDKGLADPTPATDSFVSPTEEEAKKLIGNIIEEQGYYALQEDAVLPLGASDNVWVDYLIIREDMPDAVINYIGYTKNLEEELKNKKLLDDYGIQNLYLVGIPESEIKLKIDAFLNQEYN